MIEFTSPVSTFMEPWVNPALQERINCIHEAGHVVVAHMVRMPIAWVSIDPEFVRTDPLAIKNECADDGGAVSMVMASHLLNPIISRGFAVNLNERALVIGYCCEVLAGPIAETRAFPEHFVPETARRDYGQVRQVIHRIQSNRMKARTMLRGLVYKTEQLVEMHWPAIEALAEKLRAERTIKGEEIERFLATLVDIRLEPLDLPMAA